MMEAFHFWREQRASNKAYKSFVHNLTLPEGPQLHTQLDHLLSSREPGDRARDYLTDLIKADKATQVAFADPQKVFFGTGESNEVKVMTMHPMVPRERYGAYMAYDLLTPDPTKTVLHLAHIAHNRVGENAFPQKDIEYYIKNPEYYRRTDIYNIHLSPLWSLRLVIDHDRSDSYRSFVRGILIPVEQQAYIDTWINKHLATLASRVGSRALTRELMKKSLTSYPSDVVKVYEVDERDAGGPEKIKTQLYTQGWRQIDDEDVLKPLIDVGPSNTRYYRNNESKDIVLGVHTNNYYANPEISFYGIATEKLRKQVQDIFMAGFQEHIDEAIRTALSTRTDSPTIRVRVRDIMNTTLKLGNFELSGTRKFENVRTLCRRTIIRLTEYLNDSEVSQNIKTARRLLDLIDMSHEEAADHIVGWHPEDEVVTYTK